MRTVRVLLLSICLLFKLDDTCIYAQSNGRNTIGLSFGMSNMHLLDEHASSIIFNGTGISPAINFYHKGKKNNHLVESFYHHSDLRAYTDNFKTEINAGSFRYTFLHPVFENLFLNRQLTIEVGGSLSALFEKSDYYFTDWNKLYSIAIQSWYGNYSLCVAGHAEYKLNEKNYVGLSIASPVVGNLSRPEYSPSGNYDYEDIGVKVKTFGKTVFFTESYFIDTHLLFRRFVFKDLHFQAGYEFHYACSKKPDNVKFYMNNFRIGMDYAF